MNKLEAEKVFVEQEVVDWSQYTAMDTTQEDTPTCGIGENFDKNKEEGTENSKSLVEVEAKENGYTGVLEEGKCTVEEVFIDQNGAEIPGKDCCVAATKDELGNDEESKSDEERNNEEEVIAADIVRKEFNNNMVTTRKGTGARIRRAEHQSGVPGVYWQESSQRWIAQWSDSISGRRITHGFSARVYGFEDAKQMAIKSRVDAIENGKATARKLHETSLTGKMYLNMNKSCYLNGQSDGLVGGSLGSHSHVGGIKGIRGAKYGSEFEKNDYLLKEDRPTMLNFMEKKNIQKIMNNMSDEGIGLLMEEMKHLKEDAEYEGVFWHPINKVWIGVWLDSITHEACTQSFPHEIGEDGVDISRLKAIEWRLKLINEKKLRDNVVEYVNNKEFKHHSSYPCISGMPNSGYNILNYNMPGVLNPLNVGGGSNSSSLINLVGSGLSAFNGVSNPCSNNSTEFNPSALTQNGNYQLLLSQLMSYLYNSTSANFNTGINTNSSTSFGPSSGNNMASMTPDYNNLILSNMLLLNGGLYCPSSPGNIYNSANANINSAFSNYLNNYYNQLLKQQLYGEISDSFNSKSNSINTGNSTSSPSSSNTADASYLSSPPMFSDNTSESVTRSKIINNLILGNNLGGAASGYPSHLQNLNAINSANLLGVNQFPAAGISSALNGGNSNSISAGNYNQQNFQSLLQSLIGSGKQVPSNIPNGSYPFENLDQIQTTPLNLAENALLNQLNQSLSQIPASNHQNSGSMDINGLIKKMVSQDNGASAAKSSVNMNDIMINLEKPDTPLREDMLSYNQGVGAPLASFEHSITGSSIINNNTENSGELATSIHLNKSGSSTSAIQTNIDNVSGCVDKMADDNKISRSVTSSSVESSISSNSTSFSMLKDAPNALEISESTAPTVSSTPVSSSSKIKTLSSPKKKNVNGISYKSGIPGVYWKTRDQEWVAEWYDQNRKRHSRHFYVKKYGFNEAKKLAIQCRLNAVNSGEAVLRSGANSANNNNNNSVVAATSSSSNSGNGASSATAGCVNYGNVIGGSSTNIITELRMSNAKSVNGGEESDIRTANKMVAVISGPLENNQSASEQILESSANSKATACAGKDEGK
ncbi:hypothetical protein OIY81_1039 [Cryptosporidium canis]|nr:hypothetical protein OIY81_1039 [Cryptosporidium canis]